MRLIVRCSSCSRQLDAAGLSAGSHFRCHCGSVIKVPNVQSHNADVVRCSSCGAPRQEGSQDCRFCASDFTLHEQDLHTVCPSCFARISDKARFCHHCATEILPQGRAGDLTTKPCPACEEAHLASRKLPGAPGAVFECDGCAGMWLEHDLLQSVVRQARDKALPKELSSVHRHREAGRSFDLGKVGGTGFYRPCPECGQRMLRKNWAQRSGVVVDVCTQHGVWFDADELKTILRWVHEGGLDRARATVEPRVPPSAPPRVISVPPSSSSGSSFLSGALEILLWIGLDVLLD